jgi:hypothetical protein
VSIDFKIPVKQSLVNCKCYLTKKKTNLENYSSWHIGKLFHYSSVMGNFKLLIPSNIGLINFKIDGGKFHGTHKEK